MDHMMHYVHLNLINFFTRLGCHSWNVLCCDLQVTMNGRTHRPSKLHGECMAGQCTGSWLTSEVRSINLEHRRVYCQHLATTDYLWFFIHFARVLQSLWLPAIWLRHHSLRGVDSVRLQILSVGTCRQCGSWSVAGHNPKKVIGRGPICANLHGKDLDPSGNGSTETMYDEGDRNLAVG